MCPEEMVELSRLVELNGADCTNVMDTSGVYSTHSKIDA